MKSTPNLILVGPMGCGKSSIGRQLARHLALPFVDADREIEQATGVRIPLIFEMEGEAGFRRREKAVLERLCAEDGQVIATGGGAVLDADNRAVMARRGFVLYLQVDLETQLRRLARDRSRPLLQRPDRRRVLQEIAAVREPLYAEVADLTIDTGRRGFKRTVEHILDRLPAHWPAPESTPSPMESGP